ncbi:sensor domain-containing protein [Natronomonas marina]|uniref:sensor domain-containing protein n=1 Tax=Natronomonas marina TaxID=2961939 RepID=UPI0020C998D7|nr:sensor domain-containing protein [Natronomonas marina]
MTATSPRDAVRSFLGVPLEPRTYRALVYNLLAFPLGIAYFVVLTVGLAATVGLSLTLAGPVALVVTLLSVVTLAWADGRLTGGLLGADIAPQFPDDDDPVEFLKTLVFGRLTWTGAVYLLWRFAVGVVVFVVLVAGFSLAGSLLAAPFGYGEHLAVRVGAGSVAIDTLGRALAASLVGALIGLVTLHLSNLLGEANAAVADALLDPDGR